MNPIDQISRRKFITIKSGLVPVTLPIIVLFFFVFSFINNVPLFVSALLFVIAIFLFTARQAVEVNLNKMQYRDIIKVFGMKIGKWRSLSEPDFLLLSKSTKRTGVMITIAMSVAANTLYYDVDLITKGDRDVLIARFANRDLAIEFLRDIAPDLELKVQEKVSGDFVWLTEIQ